MFNGAIVGFGKIARTNHLSAFCSDKLKDKINITSVVEIDKDTREKSEKEFSHIKFYESLDEMYSKEKIDFIDITTPPNYHKEIINWAVEKKLHVICEKPFTISYEEANEVYRKIINSNIFFIPCHQYKYSPLWQEYKSFLKELEDKSKVLLQFNVFRAGADKGLNPTSSPWRLNKKISGGGILSDIGFHYLYLSTWLLGKPNKVTTINYNLAHNTFNVEDSSETILEFDKGVVQINLTWAYHSRLNEAKLISNNGSIFYYGNDHAIKIKNGKEEKIPVPNVSDKSNYTKLYEELFLDFITALEKKDYHKNGLTEAYYTTYLLDKCYESSSTRRTIALLNE
ncbi:Gfo/Idh/MocA family protein [Melioribacteraceae bacterium 4301-Me]|uniref:Gfo/Idh/MocA family protein n=1 Tax=Pyranulibacter aquaticus TaxID=3163344 RepID=UPI00359B539C